MMVIFFRILLSWFSGFGRSRVHDILERLTDPYLDWFRQLSFLRIGFLDLSPIVALGVLALVNRVLSTLAYTGGITIGIILALILGAVWSAISFILGFMLILLVLRLAAYLLGVNSYHPFWRAVKTMSEPIVFRINRIIFKNRIVHFATGIIISITAIGIIYLALRITVFMLSGILTRVPF
jgi:YggT family protein